MNPALKAFRESREFQILLKGLRDEFRPVVKLWMPQATQDENAQLLEELKFSSARQQGFDLLYRILTGERDD